jgi:hypothetical protein
MKLVDDDATLPLCVPGIAGLFRHSAKAQAPLPTLL